MTDFVKITDDHPSNVRTAWESRAGKFTIVIGQTKNARNPFDYEVVAPGGMIVGGGHALTFAQAHSRAYAAIETLPY